MAKDTAIKKYQKKYDYSYTLGTFPTVELLKKRPKDVIRVLYHGDLDSKEQMALLQTLCEKNGIPFVLAERQVEKVRDKNNTFVVGVFRKYDNVLDAEQNHVAFVNPGDMGNFGTILRTSLAFGVRDVAIIEPACDIYNPKVIRASMGAMFSMRFHYFESFEAYQKAYGDGRRLYPFMLDGSRPLQNYVVPEGLFTLIFGNEATGLPESFAGIGQSIRIENTDMVDSLNLSIAAGCGLYAFTAKHMGGMTCE